MATILLNRVISIALHTPQPVFGPQHAAVYFKYNHQHIIKEDERTLALGCKGSTQGSG